MLTEDELVVRKNIIVIIIIIRAIARARLSTVPVVPWEGAPPRTARGP